MNEEHLTLDEATTPLTAIELAKLLTAAKQKDKCLSSTGLKLLRRLIFQYSQNIKQS